MSEALVAPSSTSSPRFRRWWSTARSSFFWMILIALIMRIGTITIGHTYKFRTSDQNFGFGWEMGRIGSAIAQGHGFSNPFGLSTGPTAWEPPLYPYLIAGVFKLFGVYSHASAFVLLTINSIFSAFTCIPIFLIAKRCFGERVAIASGWTWALLPYVTYWCVHWVWETSLSALLLAIIFLLALEMEERDGIKPWIQFGVLWGIAALNSPVLISFLPASGLWAWYHRAKAGKKSLGGVVLASAIFLAIVSPWALRNYSVFHQPVFLRSNFGAELRMGNGPGADGTWMWFLHPTQNLYALQQYQQMGELPYIAERKRQAIEWIKADPARFLGVCGKKFYYYWAGVPRLAEMPQLAQFKNSLFLMTSLLCLGGLIRALWKRRPGAWLFFWLLFWFPLVYYVVFPHARYRHPIDAEIGMLAIYLISEAQRKPRPSEPT